MQNPRAAAYSTSTLCSRRDRLYMTSSNRGMEVMGIVLFKLPKKIIAVCEER